MKNAPFHKMVDIVTKSKSNAKSSIWSTCRPPEILIAMSLFFRKCPFSIEIDQILSKRSATVKSTTSTFLKSSTFFQISAHFVICLESFRHFDRFPSKMSTFRRLFGHFVKSRKCRPGLKMRFLGEDVHLRESCGTTYVGSKLPCGSI